MVRKSQMEDYAQIENIMQQVQKLHVEWRPDVYRNVDTVLPQAVFEKLIEDGMALSYVENDAVLGIAFFQERIIEDGGKQVPKKTLFVDTMAVLDGHRGKGIGHALFDALKDIAKEKSCVGIELQVNARNENAMKMYKSYGFTEKSINMEMYF